jgi:pullulanase
MKKTLMIISWLLYIFSTKAQKSIYDSYSVYKGADLGLTYSPKESIFKIWAPGAEKVQIIFYTGGDGGEPAGFSDMAKA